VYVDGDIDESMLLPEVPEDEDNMGFRLPTGYSTVDEEPPLSIEETPAVRNTFYEPPPPGTALESAKRGSKNEAKVNFEGKSPLSVDSSTEDAKSRSYPKTPRLSDAGDVSPCVAEEQEMMKRSEAEVDGGDKTPVKGVFL
jgi:hypothetical protein